MLELQRQHSVQSISLVSVEDMYVVSLYYENHNFVCWFVIAFSRNFLQMCRYLKSKEQLLQSYIDYVELLRLQNTNQPNIHNKESVLCDVCRCCLLIQYVGHE